MDIATNIASLQGQISLKQTQAREATAIQRLSTGLRINSAADDPSGLIAATSLKSDINTLDAQQTGDNRLYSKAAMADNILSVITAVLLQAKSLTLQDANTATLDQKQLNANQTELDAIVTGIQRVGLGTTFLGQKLFGQILQSDASDAGTSTGDLDPKTMGGVYDQKTGESYSLVDLRSTGSLAMNGNPQIADEVVDAALKQVASWQASLGSFQQTLSVMGDVRGVTRVNLADALSQIEDTDFATETAEFVRDKTLEQTNIATLAVANTQPAGALSLLSH